MSEKQKAMPQKIDRTQISNTHRRSNRDS